MGPLSDLTINISLLELPELGLCFLPSIDSPVDSILQNVGSVAVSSGVQVLSPPRLLAQCLVLGR